ncbi:hypothetical protein JKY79_01490 [Candidatus Babeliales bacterium]|nr:hypothetical protein [Candidatus Babeliales bacterium]
MIQQLQVLNSLLTMIAVTVSALYFLLLQVPPRGLLKTEITVETLSSAAKRPVIVQEFIFQNDLFETFSPIEPSLRAQNQIQTMPTFQWGAINIPSEQKTTEMLPALSIILNGIVLASDIDNSIAIISDETLKERVLYVGDQVKDAFLAKIMKNKIILFRSNGQQETFFLRKEDESILTPEEPAGEWKKIIISAGESEFQIDSEQFVKKIPSLGTFIEMFGFVPVTTIEGFVGIQCEEAKKIKALQAFGLNARDLITSINDIMFTDQGKILKAYEEIVATKEGGTIAVKLQRKDQEVIITYNIKKIMSDALISLGGVVSQRRANGEMKKSGSDDVSQDRIIPAAFNKPNIRRERLHQKAMIEDEDSSDYYDTVMKIRKRLVDNMHKRSPHTYVR